MSADNPLSPDRQAALTERLRELIRHERARGIPMASILQACHDCGIIPVEHDEEADIPEVDSV